MSPNSHLKFDFLLFDGFSNMVLASALEPLRDVKQRSISADLSWHISSMDGKAIQSSSGLTVTPDRTFDPHENVRVLVLVAGYHVRRHAEKRLIQQLRLASRASTMVLALDTAPWLLASTGLLNGHAATIHWQELDAFAERFTHVDVTTARFARSGRFLTCGGASTALDMILDLIQQQFGAAAAFEASNMFIYDPARQKELGRGAKRLKDRASPKLLQALDVMANHIEHPLTTFELAARVSMSERSLNRAFQSELGMTPGKYYRLFRLQKARHLAEETVLNHEQIALRCGFSSGVSLSRAFQNVFELSIKDVRAQQAKHN